MNRSYIPFYLNKTDNVTFFYDYKAEQFFKSPGGKQSSVITILSGTAGIILYTLLKDMVITVGGQNPLFMILFSLFISCLLAIGTMWGTGYAFKRNRHKLEVIATPSKDDTLFYMQEGKKWLRSSLFLILFLFLFTLINTLLLLLDPNSGFLFLTNTLLWAILIFLIWGVRPLKRRKIYKCFHKELLNNEQKLI